MILYNKLKKGVRFLDGCGGRIRDNKKVICYLYRMQLKFINRDVVVE